MIRSASVLVLLSLCAACAVEPELDDLSQAVTGDAGSGPTGDAGGAPPVVVDDAVTTDMGQPIAFSVIANDHDPEGGALTVTLTGNADWPFSRTTYDCGSDGTCYVEAYPHESGVGTFTYQACDPTGACAEATVTVTINHIAVNVYADDDTATTDLDTAIYIAVLDNDNENGSHFDLYSLAVIAGPWYGSATPDPDSGGIEYAPGAGYRGSDLFEYSICNTDARCSTAWVYVFVDPGSPVVAIADSYPVTYQANTAYLEVGANDTNTTGAPALMTILVAPSHGQTALDWGTIYYTGDPDYSGPDFMVYQFCADGLCAATSVRVTVRGNSEPTPVNDDVITDEDTPIDFNPLANDTDPDGDVLHLNGPCYPGNNWPFFRATLECSESGPCYFTPSPLETGVGEIRCTVCDDLYCVEETVTLTVLRVPNPPEGTDDTAATTEDTAVEIHVLANDAFNGGRPDPTTMVFDPGPANGSVEVDVDTGIVTYTPAPDYSGNDAFTYHLCDVFGLCTSARVTVSIAPVEDPPAFTAALTNTRQVIARRGTPARLIATDPERGTLQFTRIAGALPDHLRLNADGTFTSTGRHHRGTYTSTIRVTDPANLTATTTLRIVVF